MGPAERADVIIDFSAVAPGTNVILYNDAPAPVPGFQPRYDYYTGNPDQTAAGGAPQTQPGFGPNTRTIMQFRVAGTPTAAFNLAALASSLAGRLRRLPAPAHRAGNLLSAALSGRHRYVWRISKPLP